MLALFLALASLAAAADLQVYAIDVEGGKSTLFVSPSGESMLVDTGYDGYYNRDADRILAAAHDAGIHQIDYLVITHYHKDHAGGVPQLASKIKIVNYFDHGPNFEEAKDNADVVRAYVATRGQGQTFHRQARRCHPHPGHPGGSGDRRRQSHRQAAAGRGPAESAMRQLQAHRGRYRERTPTPSACGSRTASSIWSIWATCIGTRSTTWPVPVNKLGKADVYLTTHHGKKTSGSPQMVWALAPKVAVMNNGPDTGGSVASLADHSRFARAGRLVATALRHRQ